MADPVRPEVIDGQGIAIRPFEQSLPIALLKAREAAMRRFRPLLADHDLTEQQWRVLRALAATDGAAAVGEVAERTFLLAPSLSRILVNLEQRGLVERTTAEHDHRRVDLSLTTEGAALVRHIAPGSEAVYQHIEASFGAERLRRLLRELHDLAAIDLDAGDTTAEEAS